MQNLLIAILLTLSVSAYAQPEYVYSLFTRAEYEANESQLITAQIDLMQKRDWGDSTDTNRVLAKYQYRAEVNGQEYALFCNAICKMGEVPADDWSDYVTACGVGQHKKGAYGREYMEQLWGFTLTTNAWRTTLIPFVQDNAQQNKKGKGFDVAYSIIELTYSEKDQSSILNNILNLPDTAENRAMVDSEFDKTSYVYELNTNLAVYVWSTGWDKEADISRKDCKKAQSQGSANASCGILRSKDTAKVMAHYRVKKKDKKK